MAHFYQKSLSTYTMVLYGKMCYCNIVMFNSTLHASIHNSKWLDHICNCVWASQEVFLCHEKYKYHSHNIHDSLQMHIAPYLLIVIAYFLICDVKSKMAVTLPILATKTKTKKYIHKKYNSACVCIIYIICIRTNYILYFCHLIHYNMLSTNKTTVHPQGYQSSSWLRCLTLNAFI